MRRQGPDDVRIGTRDLTEWRSRFGRWLERTALAVAGRAPRAARWSAANAVLVATAAIGGVVVVLLTAAATEVYDGVVERDGVASFDQPVLDQAIALRSPGLNDAVTHFTDLGGGRGMPTLAVLAVVAMAALWRSRTPVVLMLIAGAGSLAMTATGKSLVGRVRPPRAEAVPPFEHSASFPSGHTLNATVVTGIVVYLLLRRLESAWARATALSLGAAFALAMGLSRVYLGHHWVTDVIAGWLLGLAWLAAVITAHRVFLTVRRFRAE